MFHLLELTIKMAKFGQNSIQYLPFQLRRDVVQINNRKVAPVQAVPPLKNAKDLTHFLAIVG